jgi:hypothetical protein
MARMIPMTISLTETPQFKRLVEFASDVSQHASEFHDRPLAELVQNLHRDLLEMSGDE